MQWRHGVEQELSFGAPMYLNFPFTVFAASSLLAATSFSTFSTINWLHCSTFACWKAWPASKLLHTCGTTAMR